MGVTEEIGLFTPRIGCPIFSFIRLTPTGDFISPSKSVWTYKRFGDKVLGGH
jgi:hypothetical protein